MLLSRGIRQPNMSILKALFGRSHPEPNPSREEMDKFASEIRLLKLEWLETLDKVTHALDRLNKRQAKLARETEPEPQPETVESLWETVHKRGLI